MRLPHGGNRTLQDAIGDGRWIWQVLLMFEIANGLDWATSVVGIGMLGLPEQMSASKWMIARLGVVDGLTVLKATVGVAFVAVAWGAIEMCRRRWRWASPIHGVGFAWLIGVATALLVQTVIWNLLIIRVALLGMAGR